MGFFDLPQSALLCIAECLDRPLGRVELRVERLGKAAAGIADLPRGGLHLEEAGVQPGRVLFELALEKAQPRIDGLSQPPRLSVKLADPRLERLMDGFHPLIELLSQRLHEPDGFHGKRGGSRVEAGNFRSPSRRGEIAETARNNAQGIPHGFLFASRAPRASRVNVQGGADYTEPRSPHKEPLVTGSEERVARCNTAHRRHTEMFRRYFAASSGGVGLM